MVAARPPNYPEPRLGYNPAHSSRALQSRPAVNAPSVGGGPGIAALTPQVGGVDDIVQLLGSVGAVRGVAGFLPSLGGGATSVASAIFNGGGAATPSPRSSQNSYADTWKA